MVKIGFIQMNVSFGEKEKNIKKAFKMALKIEESDLIVLPELFNTGYTFTSRKEAYKLSESLEGETSKAISKLSGEIGSCIVAGFAEREGDRVYNSALVTCNGEILGTYRKIHLFYREKEWFSPGNVGFKVFKAGNFKLGVVICFDWLFPEAIRTLALRGAEIIAHPSNLILPYAQEAMLTRSIENKVFTVTANRIGFESRGGLSFKFTGQSQITSPEMMVIYRASADKEETYCAEIDIGKARNKKITDLNDIISDRRPEFYLL